MKEENVYTYACQYDSVQGAPCPSTYQGGHPGEYTPPHPSKVQQNQQMNCKHLPVTEQTSMTTGIALIKSEPA